MKEGLQIDVREKLIDVHKSVNGKVPIVMKTEFEEYYVVIDEAQGKALIEGIHYAFHPEDLKEDLGIEEGCEKKNDK